MDEKYLHASCAASIKHLQATLDKRLRRQDNLQELYEKLSCRLAKIEYLAEDVVARQEKRLQLMESKLEIKCKQIDLLFNEIKELKELK